MLGVSAWGYQQMFLALALCLLGAVGALWWHITRVRRALLSSLSVSSELEAPQKGHSCRDASRGLVSQGLGAAACVEGRHVMSHGAGMAGGNHTSGAGPAGSGGMGPQGLSGVAAEGCEGRPPPMRVVIMVVGTRGDVQPAVALAAALQADGHAVRMATHKEYEGLVQQAGVDHFYPIGGDPEALTEIAVASRGMLPVSFSAFLRVRSEYASVFATLLPAAIAPWVAGGKAQKPSLIITTPLVYGAAHVAEALGVPLHVTSAVPWVPSKHVVHPWARAFDAAIPDLFVAAAACLLPPLKTESSPSSPSFSPPSSPSSSPSSLLNVPPPSPFSKPPPLPSPSPPRTSSRTAPVTTHRTAFTAWYASHRTAALEAVRSWATWASTPLLDHLVWFGIADMLAVWRVRELGLWPFGGANHGWSLYKCPTTLTFSPALLPAPPDWPPHVTVTGPLLLAHAHALRTKNQPLQAADSCTCNSSPDAPLGTGHAQSESASSDTSSATPIPNGKGQVSSPRLTRAASLAAGAVYAAQHTRAPLGDEECFENEVSSSETSDSCESERSQMGSRDLHTYQPSRGQEHAQKDQGAAGEQQGSGESRTQQQLPEDVEQFLTSGLPPVYVGFGSALTPAGAETVVRLTLGAAAHTGTRVVFHRRMCSLQDLDRLRAQSASSSSPPTKSHKSAQSSHTASASGPQPPLTSSSFPDVHVVGDAPHGLLLPRCAGVITHGGVGTVLASLAAGRPTLVCPVYGDNFFWGELVARCGAGPDPLPAHTLTPAQLEQALEQLLQPSPAEAAARMSDALSAERGLERAVAHTYRFMSTYIFNQAKTKPKSKVQNKIMGKHKAMLSTAASCAPNSTKLVTGLVRAMSADSGMAVPAALVSFTLKPALMSAASKGGMHMKGAAGGGKMNGDEMEALLETARRRLCRFWYG